MSAGSIQQQITDTANAYGVPVPIALSVAQQESGFDQRAVGTSGEIGVFQLMPGTAKQLGVDPTDLSQNIQGGITYLRDMLNRFGGNVSQAVAAYNAGPGAVAAGRIPASTQSYVANVLGRAYGTGTAGNTPGAPLSGGTLPSVPSPIVPLADAVLPALDTTEIAGFSGLAIAIAALALLLFAA